MVEVAVQVPQFVVKEIYVFQVFQTLTERFPVVLTCRERSDPGQLGRAVDFHQQGRAPAACLKRVRLRSAAVPAALVDLKLTVPVAQGQVVKPGELWPRRIDWVGSLLLIGVEAVDGAMRKSDAD